MAYSEAQKNANQSEPFSCFPFVSVFLFLPLSHYLPPPLPVFHFVLSGLSGALVELTNMRIINLPPTLRYVFSAFFSLGLAQFEAE